MTSDAPNYRLYEHRQDESVLLVARPILDVEGGGVSEYECRRYGQTETFTLSAAAFLTIYRSATRRRFEQRERV